MPLEGSDHEPTREEIDRTEGLVLLEFGTEWCGHCRALAPKLDAKLDQHPQVRHLMIEDGPGRALGRSFGVKLWPTLVFLKDGSIVRQVSRPDSDELREGFESLLGAD